jgi:hypothetical protein
MIVRLRGRRDLAQELAKDECCSARVSTVINPFINFCVSNKANRYTVGDRLVEEL